MFKFLQCSPFDDQKVFNNQVTQKWKARSDPDSVAKLKTLVNCLSLRRPKTTIELPPRRDNLERLAFNKEEWEHYQRVKAKTRYSLEAAGQETLGATFFNALKWINELRLICNHGILNMKETHNAEERPPAWSIQEAQARFDQLEAVGLATCSNTECLQDLSSALSSETGAEHEEEPWIGNTLELWCSLCFKGQNKTASKAFKICNHLPRRSRKHYARDEAAETSLETDSSRPSSLAAVQEDERLPTKVKRLLQDLLEAPQDTKRFLFAFLLNPKVAKFQTQRRLLLLDQNIRHHSAPALGAFHPLRPP